MSSIETIAERPRGYAAVEAQRVSCPIGLSVLAAVVSEGLARSYSEQFGIGVPEWRVLATIGEFQSITAKAIGAHAHMGKVKVSRAVAALEGRALIQRTPNAR